MQRRPIVTDNPAEVRIAPSLLSCDFSRLAEEVADVEQAGADLLHVDVMDGHFVPNITIGPVVVKWLRKIAGTPLDVHLMISDPLSYIEPFLDAGSDLISFHVEATDDPQAVISKIRQGGAQVGLAISPDTPVETALPLLDQVDMAVVMTVYPGFGGQKFIQPMLDKIRQIRQAAGPDFPIEVDGGIDPETIGPARSAGANLFVAGTAVFGQADRAAAIRTLRERS